MLSQRERTIQARAYAIWEQEGRPDGDDVKHWLQAEAEYPFEPPKYLASLIAAVNDEAKAAQGGALLFMLVGLYLLATAFSASDEDLLRGKTLTIVQIGAALPVSFSFAIAPLVFVFLHIYTLVRYDLLAGNVRQFRRELKRTVEEEADRERCRQLLANIEFVEALTTPHRSLLYPRLWSWLFIGIVVVFPVAVLLLVQINALRYQSDLITAVQRVWFVLDLAALVWFISRDPLSVARAERTRLRRRALRWGLLIGLPALLIGLNFYWLGTAPPHAAPRLVRYDPEDPYWNRDHPKPWVARQPLDLWACPRLNWGCRFLRVEHRPLVDKVWDDKAMAELHAGSSTEQTKALAGIEGLVLRDRSLRFAVLDESRLYAADLSGADLRQANLRNASLPGARLLKTHLQGADLRDTQLQGANLQAHLQGADLADAQLQGANLSGAQLQGADLRRAHLQGANLGYAQMEGANLMGAQLQGADLSPAQLEGALLVGAQLQGAYLVSAELQGADLSGTWLSGADLRDARLWRATTSMFPSVLSLADLRGADFRKPLTKEEQADLQQSLASMPEGTRRQVAKQLRGVLTPEGPVPEFAFEASSSHPVLVSDPPDPALTAHREWLITAPTPAYTEALAIYLADEVAPLDPVIAAQILKRAEHGLVDPYVMSPMIAKSHHLPPSRKPRPRDKASVDFVRRIFFTRYQT
jgi:uncharacterized protein YjbI with pentapeptide repeats